MIWKVAVPRPQHSPMFGQRASSQTVWRPPPWMIVCSSRKRVLPDGARTFIHSGRWRASSEKGTLRGLRRKRLEGQAERLRQRVAKRRARLLHRHLAPRLGGQRGELRPAQAAGVEELVDRQVGGDVE